MAKRKTVTQKLRDEVKDLKSELADLLERNSNNYDHYQHEKEKVNIVKKEFEDFKNRVDHKEAEINLVLRQQNMQLTQIIAGFTCKKNPFDVVEIKMDSAYVMPISGEIFPKRHY